MTTQMSMWTLMQTAPSQLEVGEAEMLKPEVLEDGEVLLKVLTAGICGSDLPHFQGGKLSFTDLGTPRFLIHEIVGEVIASRFEEILPGDRVAGWALAQEGLSEYIVSYGHSLHSFSPNLDATKAVMLQPLACVLYAVEQIGDVTGESVAVLGVGSIGSLFAHVLQKRGAARVTGVDRVDRSDIQHIFGMDEFVHADAAVWADEIADKDRPSLIIEAIGHQVESLTAAVTAAAYEGKVFYFGIPNDEIYPIPMLRFLLKNMTLQAGITSPQHRRRVLAEAEAYLGEHPELIEVYMTSSFPFQDAQRAFEAALHPRSGQLKVSLSG